MDHEPLTDPTSECSAAPKLFFDGKCGARWCPTATFGWRGTSASSTA